MLVLSTSQAETNTSKCYILLMRRETTASVKGLANQRENYTFKHCTATERMWGVKGAGDLVWKV